MKPTEADWPAESPTFIGLVSMLIGSTDLARYSWVNFSRVSGSLP
jgi:hypothetical protein